MSALLFKYYEVSYPASWRSLPSSENRGVPLRVSSSLGVHVLPLSVTFTSLNLTASSLLLQPRLLPCASLSCLDIVVVRALSCSVKVVGGPVLLL